MSDIARSLNHELHSVHGGCRAGGFTGKGRGKRTSSGTLMYLIVFPRT